MTNQPQVGLRLNGLYSEKSSPLTIDLFLEHVVSARMVFGGFSLPTQDGLQLDGFLFSENDKTHLTLADWDAFLLQSHGSFLGTPFLADEDGEPV